MNILSRILALLALVWASQGITKTEFDELKEQFYELAHLYDARIRYKVNIPIVFDTKGINETKRINGIEPSRLIIGACVTHNSGKKHIIIHKNAWILSNTAEKRLLIFHELSHCVFNSDHNNTKLKGKEISIMSSVLINSNQYKQYYGYYDMQLMLSTRLDLHKVIKDKAITFSDYVLKYMLIVEEGYKKKLKNIKKQLRLNKK